MQDGTTDLEKRVLLVAPTWRDGEITRSLLSADGLECFVVRGIPQLIEEVDRGAGALLLTEEVLLGAAIQPLVATLKRQPAWSDLPVILLMRGGAKSPEASAVISALGNVTLLERPAPMRSLASAVGAAIRGRERQYQARELLVSEQAARLESERAGRMKDEFLATLSHELRTPLTAILGWSQLIRQAKEDPETLSEGITVIERNARMQVELIEDLLDMSRIISGNIRLDVRPINPATFIEAAIKTVMPAAEAKGIRLQKISDHGQAVINGDPSRLQQVVWNLLSNAIKFTPKGGRVQVMLKRVNSHVEISVADTGQGIAPAFLPHVFERFRQADASTTRAHGGLGLGLAIVKNLVELHGGTIEAQSAGEVRGSTFIVSLPIGAINQNTVADGNSRHGDSSKSERAFSPSAKMLKGMLVLVVDDDSDARNLIRRILEDAGAKVLMAGSAAEGMKVLESESPNMLVSDIGMPQMDGYDFIRQVRSMKDSAMRNVPAIALTAFARSEDRTRALVAGFRAHISKPVEPAELVATIASLTRRSGPE